MITTWLVPKTAARTCRPSGLRASPCGDLPTSMLLTTRSVTVLMTLTVDAPSLLA
jgi:hypothetical protein